MVVVQVTCSRWKAVDVLYAVQQAPRHGRLVMSADSTVTAAASSDDVVSAFSQDDVDNDRLYYVHTDQHQQA